MDCVVGKRDRVKWSPFADQNSNSYAIEEKATPDMVYA